MKICLYHKLKEWWWNIYCPLPKDVWRYTIAIGLQTFVTEGLFVCILLGVNHLRKNGMSVTGLNFSTEIFYGYSRSASYRLSNWEDKVERWEPCFLATSGYVVSEIYLTTHRRTTTKYYLSKPHITGAEKASYTVFTLSKSRQWSWHDLTT